MSPTPQNLIYFESYNNETIGAVIVQETILSKFSLFLRQYSGLEVLLVEQVVHFELTN